MLRTDWAIMFLLYAVSGTAADSVAPNAASVSWMKPTDEPPATSYTYKVYRGPKGQPKQPVLTTISTAVVLRNQPVGEQCYEVTATSSLGTSGPSNEGCKTIKAGVGKPTGGKVSAPTSGTVK